MPRIKPDLNKTFARGEEMTIAQYKSRIDKLAIQLAAASKQGVQLIPLTEIEPYDNQPRKSFYVVREKITSMERYGQKTPIFIARVPGQKKYLIYDGECRYRAACTLKWQAIAAVEIAYDPDTFKRDILIGAIQDRGLTNLDLAEALLGEIKDKLHADSPRVKSELEIAKTAQRLLYKMRQQQPELLRQLNNFKPNRLDRELAKLELDRVEMAILTTILGHQLNLTTTIQTTFSFIKLPEDIKEYMRSLGLNDHIARKLGTITPQNKKLEISKERARALRDSLARRAIDAKWSVARASSQINSLMSEYLKQPPDPLFGQRAARSELITAIEQLDIEAFESTQLKDLATVLSVKLAEVKRKITIE